MFVENKISVVTIAVNEDEIKEICECVDKLFEAAAKDKNGSAISFMTPILELKNTLLNGLN